MLALGALALAGTMPSFKAGQPSVEILLPERARLGSGIPITLRLRNEGRKPIQLELSGRPVAFDVVVTAADGKEIWRRMKGSFIALPLALLSLKPGEARDFTTEWQQINQEGVAVAPGRYTVRGILPAGGRMLTTEPKEVVIE